MTGLIVYPRWQGVASMALGAPVSLLAATLGPPAFWTVSLLWVAVVMAATALDALLGWTAGAPSFGLVIPTSLEVGSSGVLGVEFAKAPPHQLELALGADERLDVQPQRQHGPFHGGRCAFQLTPRRRGRAAVRALHARWPGPFRLVWLQKVSRLERAIDVVPKLSAVRDQANHLYSRSRDVGSARQLERTPSMEFHALREFARGDDSRSVAWRQSARHRRLLVRDTQAERNRTIVFAFDTGRLMCEPLEGGVPRIDHAINAAMLMAYVGLKGGDRVGLFAFGAKPGLASGAAQGVEAFGPLQRLAAGIDYSTDETNFTLGLSRLAASLTGRTLVIIFTEFVDTTSAALMVDSVGRLIERHLVLFVMFEDSELEAYIRTEPREPLDVSRAVVAGTLLRDREAVVGRLRRLGVEILIAPARGLGPALVGRYLTLKRQDRL